MEQASPALETRLYREVCEIDWWRGYSASEFYARAGSDGEAVARSPAFKWRRGEPDQEAEPVRNAHAALVRALIEDGWQPDGQGSQWFNRRFFRDAEDAVAAPPASAGGSALLPPEEELSEELYFWAEPEPEPEPEPETALEQHYEAAYEPRLEPEPEYEAEPEAEAQAEPEPEPQPKPLIHAVPPVPHEPLPERAPSAQLSGVGQRLASRDRAVQLISVAGLICSIAVGWRVLF